MMHTAGGGEQEALYRRVIARLSGAAAVLSPEGLVLAVNSHLAALIERSPEALEGHPFEECLAREYRDDFRRCLKTDTPRPATLEVTFRSQSVPPPAARLLLHGINLSPPVLVLVAHEIHNPILLAHVREQQVQLRKREAALEALVTERTAALEAELARRKEAEEVLRAALAENVTLLREVHHRVKNNLQMLCDMLYLQMEGIGNEEKAAVLRDTYSRIYAIARLHEHLYRSMHGGRVLLRDYLGQLIGGFETLYPRTTIRLDVPSEPIQLDVDRAIHAGLIANELLTNAAKHAFPPGEAGEAVVRLRALGDRVELQVRDAGNGLPEGFDLTQAKTLGLRIVHILANRLGATVNVENRNGTAFTIAFPMSADAPVEPLPG